MPRTMERNNPFYGHSPGHFQTKPDQIAFDRSFKPIMCA